MISYSVMKAQQLMSGGQQLRSKLWVSLTGKVSGHYKTENLSGNKSFSVGQGRYFLEINCFAPPVKRSTTVKRKRFSLDGGKGPTKFRWSGTQASSDYAQGVIQDTVDEASVSTATPDWRTYSAVE